jgi:hypothetical protein
MDSVLAAPDDRLPTLEDIWLQLHLVFECIWDYRFVYRDLVDITQPQPQAAHALRAHPQACALMDRRMRPCLSTSSTFTLTTSPSASLSLTFSTRSSADLRDVHQAVAAGQDGDEGAEVHQLGDLALVDLAHLHVGGDLLDALARLFAGGLVHRGDLDRAVVGDVDGGAGLLGDARMVTPPLPITSRILSGLIFMVMIARRELRTSRLRGAVMALAISPRMCKRPPSPGPGRSP